MGKGEEKENDAPVATLSSFFIFLSKGNPRGLG
jgi:hypothetical protein